MRHFSPSKLHAHWTNYGSSNYSIKPEHSQLIHVLSQQKWRVCLAVRRIGCLNAVLLYCRQYPAIVRKICCADGSFCNCTRMLTVNRSVPTLRHKNLNCFKYALISSAKEERGLTGNVCRKSPNSFSEIPPSNGLSFLKAMVSAIQSTDYQFQLDL